jgi:Ni,Fe-hydrogenase III small subunit/NAD-dependent dihydropyrimidine dehydrogenase PreA subunit
MLKILLARFQQGHRTSSYPLAAPSLPDRFRGAPALDPAKCVAGCTKCIEACPTDALGRGAGSQSLELDMGRCLFCTDCTTACPEGAISFTSEYRLGARAREHLVVRGEFEPRAKALEEKTRRLFGRSLKLRVVSAGGCNGCEADVNVLGTIVFDLGRFGIQFVASPRHADGVLVTGPVTTNMRLALQKTYDAVPSPKIVIAVGACAISGGPYAGLPEVHGGAGAILPVDLHVPGCPPHPFTILDGLLGLLGRLEDDPKGTWSDRARAAASKIEEENREEARRWGARRADEAARLLGVGTREQSDATPRK